MPYQKSWIKAPPTMSFFTLTGLYISKKGHLMLLLLFIFLNHGMKASISKFHFQFSLSISVFLTFLLPIFVERWEQGQEMTKAGFKIESPQISPKISECEQTANPTIRHLKQCVTVIGL